jgi:probable aminopeptidase NPEPL1
MIKIRFVDSATAVASVRDTFCVIAPRRRLARGVNLGFRSREAGEWIAHLVRETSPGDLGALATSSTRAIPARMAVGVLPDDVSRHDSPARAEMIRRAVSGAGFGARGTHGLLILLDDPSHALAAANAVCRALPSFSLKSKREREAELQVAFVDADDRLVRLSNSERAVCEGAREMAALVDTPPTDLDPAHLAAAARRFLKGVARVKINEIVGRDLVAAKLNGIYGVGKAAVTKPRMLVATYAPRRATRRHIALVGKGVTFDTGGLSLKSPAHMTGMKADMGGAAAVLGAFRALAIAQCSARISLVLCLAENAIGPGSFKVDDVLTLHSGRTVEINNTDAEGRLLLADGVSYAARKLGATIVLDAATLTGAQLVATGLLHAGVVSNDGDLEELIVRTGRECGDLCHPLPYAPAYFKQEFKSAIADMKNSVKDRNNAPASAAAQFILNHVDDVKGLRYGHVDLAGPAFPSDRATGFGVALLYKTVLALAAE